MADKGRDLKVSVLSDANDFDLAKPADQLDDVATAAADADTALRDLADSGAQLDHLGDSARVAGEDVDDLARSGRKLDDLGRDAKAAGTKLDALGRDATSTKGDVDDLGDQAKVTASKVADAFDRIAKESKGTAQDVNRSMDKAGDGLDDFKEESASTARESAASFSGSFDDIAGSIQEVAANAFAGFGPMGAAAGLAAAAGIGVLVSSITAAKERVKELAEGLLDLRLDPEMDTAAGRVRQVLDQLRDDGDLNRFRDAAKEAGIEWSTYVRALAEGGPAADQVRDSLFGLTDGLGGAEGALTSQGRAATDLLQRLRDQAAAQDAATGSADAYTQAQALLVGPTEEASEAVDGLADALESFTDSGAVYAETLAAKEEKERQTAQATADATKDQKDSWEDYVKDVDVSVGEYLAALEKQITAQEDWATNLQTLAKRGVDDGVLAELERMGPEGAPLVAKLTTASDSELSKMADLYRRKGADSSSNLADAISDGKPKVAGATQDIRDDMRRRLSGRIDVPVGVNGPSASELANVRAGIRAGLSGITVSVNAIAQSALGRVVP